ncbi:MAG: 4Fe-4S binding protein [Actinomycetes bacterium]|jgi:indolepyruvate ferredoxin oxidoreductase alpha subunit|nr:4Fe-4S binding protein [Actinomycetes bacterium]
MSAVKLLMGNEAIALGALRAGVRVCTGYPGTPSSEILETIAREHPAGVHYEWSVNEKSALELAAGAAQSGARSMVTMKQVGLNVASDPLMSLNYTGVAGGLVVVVADDPGPISSQTEQDSRRFAQFARLCCFDPATPEEAYLMMEQAFELSERIGRPVVLRPTTRVCHSYSTVQMRPRVDRCVPSGFQKDDSRWVIFPRLAYANKLQIEQALADLAASRPPMVGDTYLQAPAAAAGGERIGIAAGGVTWQYLLEALDLLKDALAVRPALLKVGVYPLAQGQCREFLSACDRVLVLEELDAVIEDALALLAARSCLNTRVCGKRTGDSFLAGEASVAGICDLLTAFIPGAGGVSAPTRHDIPAPPLPQRPPVLCAGCPHRGSFFAVKYAMRGRRITCSGDIGCYTLGNAAPLAMVDTCLCMGAGITQAQGIAVVDNLIHNSEEAPVHFAFIGDSTFLHTGVAGLMNAAWNGHDIVVCILDNSTTAMTGGQPHPGMGRRLDGSPAPVIDIESVCRAAGADRIYRANAFDFTGSVDIVQRAAADSGVRVIIFSGPCINLVPRGTPLTVTQSCTGCGRCTARLGCPALSMLPADGTAPARAQVDAVLCTGCGLCAQICPAGALVSTSQNRGDGA